MLVEDVLNKYLSPFVSKQYCLYFYIVSMFFGLSFIVVLFVGFFTYVTNYKKINLASMLVANWALFLANNLIGYFINRLFYSMCVNSLT
jgi:hypothetical protein